MPRPCDRLPEPTSLDMLLAQVCRLHYGRAHVLLERVGLGEEQVYRRAGALSGGQQQRVGIARAFIAEPAVVLADEPVASLDPRISRAILILLKEASRERDATVLCSLHQVDLAREFADRVVGMHAGAVVYDGDAAGLDDGVLRLIYDRPLSRPPRSAENAGGFIDRLGAEPA